MMRVIVPRGPLLVFIVSPERTQIMLILAATIHPATSGREDLSARALRASLSLPPPWNSRGVEPVSFARRLAPKPLLLLSFVREA